MSAARCPICGEPADPAFRPFCSKRCKDVDLNRWLKGVYAIPAVEADDDDLGGEDGFPGGDNGADDPGNR